MTENEIAFSRFPPCSVSTAPYGRYEHPVIVQWPQLFAGAFRRTPVPARGARPPHDPMRLPMMLTPSASTMVLKVKATRA